jgi:hypothetical protein
MTLWGMAINRKIRKGSEGNVHTKKIFWIEVGYTRQASHSRLKYVKITTDCYRTLIANS